MFCFVSLTSTQNKWGLMRHGCMLTLKDEWNVFWERCSSMFSSDSRDWKRSGWFMTQQQIRKCILDRNQDFEIYYLTDRKFLQRSAMWSTLRINSQVKHRNISNWFWVEWDYFAFCLKYLHLFSTFFFSNKKPHKSQRVWIIFACWMLQWVMNEGWNSQRSCKTWAKNTTPELFFFCFCFLLFFLFDSLIWDFFVFRSTSEKTKPLWADLKTRTSERMTKPLLWQRSLRRNMWVLSLVNIRNVVTYKQHDDVVRRLSAGRQTQEKGGSHSGLDRHRTRLRWRGFVHRQLRGCESVSSRTFGLLKNYWLINQRQIIHPGLFFKWLFPCSDTRLHFLSCFPSDCPQMWQTFS